MIKFFVCLSLSFIVGMSTPSPTVQWDTEVTVHAGHPDNDDRYEFDVKITNADSEGRVIVQLTVTDTVTDDYKTYIKVIEEDFVDGTGHQVYMKRGQNPWFGYKYECGEIYIRPLNNLRWQDVDEASDLSGNFDPYTIKDNYLIH